VTTNPLVEALGGAHGGLDGQGAHVLPSLLQERDEVVDGQHDVTNQLVLGHANVANGDTHAEHLLQLELDGGLDLVHLVVEVLSVRDGRGELSGLGETRSEETGNPVMRGQYVCRMRFGLGHYVLLDEGVGSDEGIVLASKLLDKLLVLVELLQVVGAHGVDTMVLRTIDVVLVTKNANGHACSALLAPVLPLTLSLVPVSTYEDGGWWGA
jgi:hypothetical protein